jgi:GNAT superfamily N-acetyltransferase
MKTPEVAAPDEFRGNLHETAATAGQGGRASQKPGPQQAGEESFTYHHAPYDRGQHWFSAEHDGDEVGHAYAIERQGPGGPYVEITELWTNPHYRGQGIGSQLLDNAGEHFTGHELRLKPYPIDPDGQDEASLREFYSNCGFGDYQLGEGDPVELYDYMTKRASSRPAKPDGTSPVYLHGGPNRMEPGDVIHQDAMPQSHERLSRSFFTSREVAEDAADMRDGLSHGWIHTVQPAGHVEADHGEPDSWKSQAPPRVVSVESGRRNGDTPPPPVLRQQKTADVTPRRAAGGAAPALAALGFPAASGPGRPGSPAASRPDGPDTMPARTDHRLQQQAPRRARGR